MKKFLIFLVVIGFKESNTNNKFVPTFIFDRDEILIKGAILILFLNVAKTKKFLTILI